MVKIFDFGISKQLQQGPHTKNCVTRCYRPPEIFFGDRFYSIKVDIWSTACTIYELLTSKLLFEGTSDIEVVSRIFEVLGTPTTDEWPECEDLPCYLPFNEIKGTGLQIADHATNNFLMKMLQVNPKNRC